MKTVTFIITALLAVVLGSSSYAQMHDMSKMASTKTETIKVWGNCGSCKARIEKTAKVNGVSSAVWDSNTKLLTIVYDSATVNVADIEQQLAKVGHDTEKYTATQAAYNALPGCCKYERHK